MFIKPTVAIDKGWIKGDFTDKNVQPNAIDFTLDRLFSIHEHHTFVINEDKKEMRGGEKLNADFVLHGDDNMYWRLNPHTSYDGMSDFYVSVPEGVAALLIIRSTFNRNGIFLTSGLYDSGYEGHCGFALHNNSGVALISPGTRVGQIIFVDSESAKMYDGGWNHNVGTHHSE